MTIDYKPPRRDENRGSGRSLFIGLMLGLILGIVIAAGVALYISRLPNPFAQNTHNNAPDAPKPTEAAPPAMPDANASAKDKEVKDKDRFKFYDILPGKEAAKPSKDAKAVIESADTAAGETKPETPQSKPEPEKPAGATTKTSFYLQAGAFQSEDEADNQKAKLALLGYDAQVRPATVPDKGKVFRVRLGPYDNQDQVNDVRNTLKENSIDASVIKIVKAPAPTQGN